jgi:hypothetical protein
MYAGPERSMKSLSQSSMLVIRHLPMIGFLLAVTIRSPGSFVSVTGYR